MNFYLTSYLIILKEIYLKQKKLKDSPFQMHFF